MRHKPVFVSCISDRGNNAVDSIRCKSQFSPECDKRTFVGRFSEKIHLQKLLRGERPFGEAYSMDMEQEECGVFYKGKILRNVSIKFPHDIASNNQFRIFHKTMTSSERRMLQGVPNIMINGSHRMYQSNPFNSDIGRVKLYLDKFHKVHRCIINDLYCYATRANDELFLLASITLIDSGEYITKVRYNYIYDFSQRTNYLEETEPETFVACLHLPNHNDKMVEIYGRFKQIVKSSVRGTLFDIKILEFEDNCYKVDIITMPNEISYLGVLIEQFEPVDSAISTTSSATSSLGRNEENCPSTDLKCTLVPPPSSRKSHKSWQQRMKKKPLQTRYLNGSQKIGRIDLPSSKGAVNYFRRFTVPPPPRGTSYVASRMCKVMLLDWLEPHQLTILPFDREYIHEIWALRLQSLECVKTAGDESNIKVGPYAPGEFIFFKNYYNDEKLGLWLRGRVVSLSCYNEHGLVISQRRTEAAKQENFKILLKLVKRGQVNPDDLVYRVRSIDYGCECRASPIDMRCVRDLNSFRSLGTWSLRCKLFGIYPYESDKGEYPLQSLDAFNSWINERFDEDETGFRVLFRNRLDSGEGIGESFDKLYEVSLFHRYDPALHEERFGYLLKPEPERFDCLNWYMVDKGFACSSPTLDAISSKIMLEDHVVSRLVAHKMI